jgi:hypothetical protein
VSSSPWILLYPQLGLSRARRSINEVTVSSRGGPSLSGWCETPRVSGVLIEGGIGDPGARVHPIRQTGRVVHAGRAD